MVHLHLVVVMDLLTFGMVTTKNGMCLVRVCVCFSVHSFVFEIVSISQISDEYCVVGIQS
jgi:hypothetical protein